MARKSLSAEQLKSNVSNYNKRYYMTITKIRNQNERAIRKAGKQFTLLKKDKVTYRSEWIDFVQSYSWDYFYTGVEDIFQYSEGKISKNVNKRIRSLNKSLKKEYRLPVYPKEVRSLKSFSNYTVRYFNLLFETGIIERVVYTFEQTKRGFWHVHALIKSNTQDVKEHLHKNWCLADYVYCEPIKDLKGASIYITKKFKPLSLKKLEIDRLIYSTLIGNYRR